MSTQPAPIYASFDPATFVRGGLVNDVDVEIKSIKAIKWDYEGRLPDKVLGIEAEVVVLGTEGADGTPDVEVLHWSAGSLKDWVPSEDGYHFSPAGGPGSKSGLNDNSNFTKVLIPDLLHHGFPLTKIQSGDLRVFLGLGFHLLRVAPPKREGLKATEKKEGERQGDGLVYSCSKIHWLPGESARRDKYLKALGKSSTATKHDAPPAGQTAGAPPPSAAPPASAPAPSTAAPSEPAAVGSADTEALSALTKLLNGSTRIDSFTSPENKRALFRSMNHLTSAVRNEAVVKLASREWLESQNYMLDDSGTLEAMPT